MGNNVIIGLSVINVLLSRYDTTHESYMYMKGVMNIKQYRKDCTLTYYAVSCLVSVVKADSIQGTGTYKPCTKGDKYFVATNGPFW